MEFASATSIAMLEPLDAVSVWARPAAVLAHLAGHVVPLDPRSAQARTTESLPGSRARRKRCRWPRPASQLSARRIGVRGDCDPL